MQVGLGYSVIHSVILSQSFIRLLVLKLSGCNNFEKN